MAIYTSEFAGYIRGMADEMDASGAPIDTAVTRHGIVNNLLHLGDESGQVLVCTRRSRPLTCLFAAPSTS